MSQHPDPDTLDELIGPVCTIADLRPTNEWPDALRALVGYARRVRDLYGFHVETMSGGDDE